MKIEKQNVRVALAPNQVTVTFSELVPDIQKQTLTKGADIKQAKDRYKYQLMEHVRRFDRRLAMPLVINDGDGIRFQKQFFYYTEPYTVAFTHVTDEPIDRFVDNTVQKWIVDGLLGAHIFPNDSCDWMSVSIATRRPSRRQTPYTEVNVLPFSVRPANNPFTTLVFDEIFPKSSMFYRLYRHKPDVEQDVEQLLREWKSKVKLKLDQTPRCSPLLIWIHHTHTRLFDVDNRFHGFVLECLRERKLISDTDPVSMMITGEVIRGSDPKTEVKMMRS